MSRAPERSIEGGQLLEMFTEKNGRRHYRQMDDELLAAFEADCATGAPTLATMMGMMIARIRAAERDRDNLLAAVGLLLYPAEKWRDDKTFRIVTDADRSAVDAGKAIFAELAR